MRTLPWLALSFAVAAAASLASFDARACGGCMHGEPPPPPPGVTESPTVVTDHRMVLAAQSDVTTLWDQIEYAGDPGDFVWVLPIRGAVSVGVGSNAFVDALDQLTAPKVHSPAIVCNAPPGGGGGGGGGNGCFCFGMSSSDDSAGYAPLGGGGVDGGVDESGVVVTGMETVGPYDVVQIHGKDEGSIVGWLRTNKYVIPTSIEPILTAYVAEGFDFVAVRLHPGKGVQSMRPIRVSWRGATVSLPLRMVAAGVGASVGIKLFVVGSGRWRTKNFPSFVIDPTTLTWDFATESSNYVTERAARAKPFGGSAFALESSVDLRATQIPTTAEDPPPELDAGALDASDSAPDDATPTDGADASEVATDASDAGSTDSAADVATGDDATDSPAIDPRASDVVVAFGSQAHRRVTRLRADLPVSALASDLVLEADESQALVAVDVPVTKYKNELTVCPYGATGLGASGAPASILGAASCGIDGNDHNPLRGALYVALGAIAAAFTRRSIRRRR